MPRQLLFLEFNEINFEHVAFYCQRGLVPNLDSMLRAHGMARTHSESAYEHIEPWIQWVTAHSGLSLAEHGVFRLGDIVQRDIPQIWEQLEERGLKVGAISPMNAKHRLKAPAFFVPDPWTATAVSAPPRLVKLHGAIAEAVKENAQSKVTASLAAALAAGFLAYARPANYLRYGCLAARSVLRAPWRKAVCLDLLLADVFIRETARTRPDFATLFLNAGAHIQHHYMFAAASYNGKHRNPEWYVRRGVDPILEVYKIYDRILGEVIRSFPTARIMIATGLHQDPNGELTYYWRLRDHAAFLRSIEVPFMRVEPRMSRDFFVMCDSTESAARAAQRLRGAISADGVGLFSVDNRGTDLFVELVYPHEIDRTFEFTIGTQRYADLKAMVTFVALKNGRHNSIGYFLDSGSSFGSGAEFALKEMPQRIMDAFEIDAASSRAAA